MAKTANSVRLSSSEKAFEKNIYTRCKNIIEKAEENINAYIVAYSKASINVLGDKNTGATGRLLNSNLFGRTFRERTHEYVNYFFTDCVKMIYGGRKLKMKAAEIEKMVQSEFKEPYVNGTIDKANAKMLISKFLPGAGDYTARDTATLSGTRRAQLPWRGLRRNTITTNGMER